MNDIIQARLRSLDEPAPSSNALRQVLQEIALFGLWRGDFFELAAFQGGTSLRILHGLPRYSEDLDFILRKPDAGFSWGAYTQTLADSLGLFGIGAEIAESDSGTSVKRLVIRDTSLAQRAGLPSQGKDGQLRIKCEVDTNPPSQSDFGYSYCDFPSDFEICHQDLPSNFALKIHALLCRPWPKGRDWFDFSWYVRQRVAPNLPHLQAALNQSGPWQGRGIQVDAPWLRDALTQRIGDMDWQAAKADVERFLQPPETEGLRLWSERFFMARLEALMGIIS